MGKNKFSILYVDDEISNLHIFKNTFRKEYTIFTAESAKEGINILEREKIDIIISDQRMPEMTGVEFLEYAFKKHPQLNRILITGYTDFSAIKNAINDAKIYQFVQKPWREDDLHNTIKEALKIYELEKENKELIETLKKTNEKLKIEKEKVENSNKLKSIFLQNISHEIRTPMNGIMGFSKLLENNNLPDEDRHKYINIIIRSGERLLKIIDDIVEISQLVTKQININNTKINISNLFEDIYSICVSQSNKDNLKIILKNEITPENSIVFCDETKISRITTNILDNAIRYTEKGIIEMICKIQNNILEVSVKDTGIGIAKDMHDEIFERFSQEDENISQVYNGLGLGLAIVKENINLLGGTIKLESEKGKGSVFTFKIPVTVKK